MNWKLEAKEKLQSYPTRRASLSSLKNELRRLEYEAEGLKSPSLGESVQASHGRDDRLVNNLVHRKELEQRLRETELWLGTVDGALSALTEQERLVLRRMYMEPGRGNLDRLCEELELEKSMVYRRRDGALERFTSALYGI
jgi:hypothetical protein